MFGISPLGWLHTLGSLPAIPAMLYMFARYGRIVPRSVAGTIYLVAMLIGAASVFLVTHQPAGFVIGAVTLLLLLVGYTAGGIGALGRAARYVETVSLSLTAFLLMLPTVTEVLRRVPDGHPFVTSLDAPLLRGAQAGLLGVLVVGLAVQIVVLRRSRPA
ncbi:hypothetical protein MWN33_09510 [Starkeya koreensis]|uniref:Uncharacterized protein n=1 Tax=Ancylobacter koreensis TaxID=266121 RepID=A0ABT0DLW1_9HYPH|nr:hypothetical protein [Ancylobacter koreensis]MCK0208267.1 hypothetical protein [Ancylobacter koreensis]